MQFSGVATFTTRQSEPSSSRPILVVKFGGSVLTDGKNAKKAAEMLKRAYERGFSLVVVVSALKGVTDQLLNMTRATNPNVSDEMLAEILSMGERTSARLMAATIEGVGLKAKFMDPTREDWPIVSYGNYLNAEVNMEKTSELVKKYIAPLLKQGYVPVVCGFIGKNAEGKIQTLGRGGSDTTAVVLGNALKAKEVVLVKDVAGAFSADPKKAKDARVIEELDAEEALMLSVGGSKLIHSKAFKYLEGGIKLRITSLSGDIRGGTVIDGVMPQLEVEISRENISMITVVGRGMSTNGALAKIAEAIRSSGGSLHSLSMDDRAIIAYVEGGTEVYDRVHEMAVKGGLGKATSFFEDLVEIRVRGKALEIAPGYIQKITVPLGKAGINIYGLVTIASSIRVYLAKKDAEKGLKLIKEALGLER